MAVHMVRVFCEPPKGDAEVAIGDWITNYSEWDNDPVNHSLTETNTKIDGSGTQYVCGDWRFIQNGEEGVDILQDLSNKLQSIQGGLWHLLGYHICKHDEQYSGNCSWGESVEWGDVPNEVLL